MTTWTPTARQELENHLAGMRLALAGSGADPDEVLDDLRRHVTEEAAAARLPVVTEADVRRFLARAAPPAGFPEPTSGARRGPAGERTPGAMPEPERHGPSWVRTAALALFGIVLPLIALGFEWFTRACAQEFFDPLPTVWHALLVGVVPAANALALLRARGVVRGGTRVSWLLNGWALGVGAAYTALFLPLTPFAFIGVIFGLGFLPLAPLFGLISSGDLRAWLGRVDGDVPPRFRRDGWLAAAGAVALLVAMAVSSTVTRHFARLAVGEDPARAESAMGWLRDWGDREILLRDCYGYRRGLWDDWLPERVAAEPARQLYFRVTGQPFNAVPAPKTARSRQNRAWFDEFDLGAEWDSALGGEAVAGRVRGLSLTSSRLDALADADAAWSYVEWTLEFRNDHERSQREARAQVQLPPGGVVSRVTLWVNGEEREAAFAGRSQVRAAYQKVAVQQRRDPVLVTTSGPDRVLVQCFPVAPNGGTMRIRLGITSPLTLVGTDQAVVTWPRFLERNFGVARSLEHGLWLETGQAVVRAPDGLAVTADDRGRNGLHGQWTDAALADPGQAIVLRRDPAAASAWGPDRMSGVAAHIRQRISAAPAVMPSRVALVIDASVGMDPVFGEIAAALEGGPAGPEVEVFVVRDGVVRVHARGDTAAAARAVRDLRGEGGHDPVPALVQAWEWAAVQPGGLVLWLHGPQPVLVSPVDSLRQRLEWGRGGVSPRLVDFQVRPGPNRVIEKLDGLDAVTAAARMDSVRADLERLLASWSGREPGWVFERERLEGNAAPAGVEAGRQASAHVTRLWALGEARRLWRERHFAEATAMAARYQLVTPASGAVVLETRQQFADAGLQPVDPATVPAVPEPGVMSLLVVGAALLMVLRREGGRQRTGRAVVG